MEENKKVRPADKSVVKKKSKKLLITTLIIAGILVLAGIGFAIWWFVFYSSDKQVLDDAFYNVFATTEGTADIKITAKIAGDNITAPDMNIEANLKTHYNRNAVALDIDGKFSASIMSISASANLVGNKNGEVYVKINGLNDLLTKFGLGSSALGGFDVSKVSDKWIKISQDDLKNLISQTKFTPDCASLGLDKDDCDGPVSHLVPQIEADTTDYAKCLEKAADSLIDGKDVQKELLTAIKDSKVLTAKRVGNDKDGIKFQLTGDLSAVPAFGNKLKEMKVVKALMDCMKVDANADGEALDLSSASEMLDRFKIETYFWVGAWGHQPTRLLINVKMNEPNVKITIDMTDKPGKTEVKMPSSSTSLKSIIEGM